MKVCRIIKVRRQFGDDMYNKILTEIKDKNLINPGDRLVVAVSGGPDSMAILDLLEKMNKANDLQGIKLHVAHVNHNTRKHENKKEEDLIRVFCSKHNLPFYKTDYIHDESKGNFHDLARTFRYNFFKDIASKTGSGKIVLAHHEDDQVETILLRIIRGSTLEGYTGMNMVSNPNNEIKIVRPLINTKKSEIINYCYEFNVNYEIDSSNKSNKYARNKVRNQIIPLLEELQPKLNDKVLQLKHYIEEVTEYIGVKANEDFKLCIIRSSDEELVLDCKQLSRMPLAIQRKIIFYAINQITDNKLELSYEKSNIIINMMTNGKPNLELDLGNRYKCMKAYNELIFRRFEEESEANHLLNFSIDQSGRYKIRDDLEISVNFVSDIQKINNKTLILCYNSIEWPIYVRTRKNGDKIKIKTGHKKLKDLFIDHKIPRHQRDQWPLLVDGKGNILWVIHLKKAHIELPPDQKHYIKIETL